MLTKTEKWRMRILAGSMLAVMITILLIVNSKWSAQSAQVETQTGIEVRATVGVPAENKLGGIQFAVSDRWGYDKVYFNVRGFDKGLTLDGVACNKYHNGKYIQKGFLRWDAGWNTWLERFQEVLAEATVGEKNTDLLDPNAISVE